MNYQVSKCKFCGDPIEWGRLFDGRHPFNLDGVSHMDTCPKWDKRSFGLRTLGDLDTFYRQRWQQRFLGESREGFDPSRLSLLEVELKQRLRLGEVLYYVGGPLHYENWKPVTIAEHCTAGGYTDEMALVAMVVDTAILFRLRDHLGEEQVRPYCVDGLHLLSESLI